MLEALAYTLLGVGLGAPIATKRWDQMLETGGTLHLWHLPRGKVHVGLDEFFKRQLCVAVKALFGGCRKEFSSFTKGHLRLAESGSGSRPNVYALNSGWASNA